MIGAEAAGRAVGARIFGVWAASEGEFDAAFTTAIRKGAGALLIAPSVFFVNHTDRLVELVAKYRLPAIYHERGFAAAGGLMSYGPNRTDVMRQVGVYTRPRLEGREAGRLAGDAAHKVRIRPQSQDRKGARPHDPNNAFGHRRRGDRMKRREFIAGLGSAAAWPVVARGQQSARMRRVGVLMEWDENDPVGKAWISAFTHGLSELGWVGGRNMRIDVHWTRDSADQMQMLAKELVDLQPDVIVATSTPSTAALQRETKTVSRSYL